MNLYVAKGEKSNKPIFTLLRKSAEEVFKYFGVEFLYRDKSGVDIFTNAIGVELRLNGIEYSNATFPICYKNHQVSDFSFDFVFPNGEIANVYSYKNKEEIEEKLEEFKTYLKLFNLKKGYLICFPLIEEDKVLIEAVENITK